MVNQHINYFLGNNHIDRLNKLDTSGFAPIHYAAKFNRFDIMKRLVGAGESVDDEDDEDDLRSG